MDRPEIAERFDMDALRDSFIEAVKANIEPGQTFKTSEGYKWKFVAERANVFVARHGEFLAVMTLTHLSGSNVSVSLELKDAPSIIQWRSSPFPM